MPQNATQSESASGKPKVAHVRKYGREKVLDFNKARSRSLPPGMLFGQDVRVVIHREGRPFSINSSKIADRGISLSDLTENDRVEIHGVEDFYGLLFDAGLQRPGLIVAMDSSLKAALELAKGTRLTIGVQLPIS